MVDVCMCVQLRCNPALVTADCHPANPSPLKLNYGELDGTEVEPALQVASTSHDPDFDLCMPIYAERLCLPQGIGRPRSCHGFDLSQRLASGR